MRRLDRRGVTKMAEQFLGKIYGSAAPSLPELKSDLVEFGAQILRHARFEEKWTLPKTSAPPPRKR